MAERGGRTAGPAGRCTGGTRRSALRRLALLLLAACACQEPPPPPPPPPPPARAAPAPDPAADDRELTLLMARLRAPPTHARPDRTPPPDAREVRLLQRIFWESSSDELRGAALDALARSPDPTLVPFWLALAESEDGSRRAAQLAAGLAAIRPVEPALEAARSLLRKRPDLAGALLGSALALPAEELAALYADRGNDALVRAAALRRLAKAPGGGPAPDLVAALRDPEGRVRFTALELLPPAPFPVEAVLPLLADPSEGLAQLVERKLRQATAGVDRHQTEASRAATRAVLAGAEKADSPLWGRPKPLLTLAGQAAARCDLAEALRIYRLVGARATEPSDRASALGEAVLLLGRHGRVAEAAQELARLRRLGPEALACASLDAEELAAATRPALSVAWVGAPPRARVTLRNPGRAPLELPAGRDPKLGRVPRSLRVNLDGAEAVALDPAEGPPLRLAPGASYRLDVPLAPDQAPGPHLLEAGLDLPGPDDSVDAQAGATCFELR